MFLSTVELYGQMTCRITQAILATRKLKINCTEFAHSLILWTGLQLQWVNLERNGPSMNPSFFPAPTLAAKSAMSTMLGRRSCTEGFRTRILYAELMMWIALCFMMVIIGLPNESDYWGVTANGLFKGTSPRLLNKQSVRCIFCYLFWNHLVSFAFSLS